MKPGSPLLIATLAASGLLVALGAGPVAAHAQAGAVGGLASGFLHPIFGWDHVVAMVAVGLWGAYLGAPSIWLLPVVFPVVMAFGGALGIAGLPLPAVETGIAASGVILGLLIAFAVRLPIWVAAVIVGAFASSAPCRHRLWLSYPEPAGRLCCPCRRSGHRCGRNGVPDRGRLTPLKAGTFPC
jgi:HupE / UreJ protein